jgi:outer membrane protein OmpA-like peptidoglycan-associated protein
MKKSLLSLVIAFLGLPLCAQEMETIVEDFNNNNGKWFTGTSGTKEATIEGGFYKIKNNDSEYSNNFLRELRIDANEDYTIEAKMKQTAGPTDYGVGILYGYYTWGNYARVLTAGSGHISAKQRYNEESTNVLEWKKDTEGNIKGLNEWNILKVVKSRNGISLYVNDVLQKDIPIMKFIGHKTGFVCVAEQAVTIDWIKVTRKKQQINLAQDATKGELENLGPNVNSKYIEKSPNISADGKTLYFSIAENPEKNIGEKGKSDIAISKLGEDGTWGPLELLPAPVNNASHNYIISVSPDENSALFGNVYLENGGMTSGISYGIKRNGAWETPKKVTVKNYKNDNEYSDYWLSPDGLKLISACENGKSYGEKDLFVSSLNDDGTWSEPKNMGPSINTWAPEFTPYIAADGVTMFFSSYGHEGYGSADVFMSKRLDDSWTNWSKPVNMGPVINSENWDAYFRIDAQGMYGYMVSTGEKSLGEEDIFRIKLGEGAKPELLNLVSGKVYNAKTNEVISAAIEYEDLTEGTKLGIAYSTSDNGYKIILPKGKKYGFLASAEGFIAVSNNLDLTKISKYSESEVNLYLVPIESGQTLTLNNLFFDSRRSILKKESFSELNRLVKIMIENPDLKIEIGGHTDNVGEQDYNMGLSQDRAKAVYNYLAGKGVPTTRMKAVGYGEAKPKVKNDTEAGRKQNRRVELTIE